MSNEEKIGNNKMGQAKSDNFFSNLSVPPSKRSKEEAWQLLMQSIDEKEEHHNKSISLKPSYTKLLVAASIAILFLISSVLIFNKEYHFETYEAQTLKVDLPDGSFVNLNENSSIAYSLTYGWFNRKVSFEGEGYFTVTKGKGRFIVDVAQNKKIVVTGTEFNVISRDKDFSVTCYEGSVEVSTPKVKPLRIKAGEQVLLDNEEFKLNSEPVNRLPKPVWLTNEFVFINQPLSIVFDELSRYYKVRIVADGFNPSERQFSGKLPADSFSNILEIMSVSLGLSYSYSPDSTTIVFR
jgi:ferric-dicitrate binding protein FerR (iron transport regulator)